MTDLFRTQFMRTVLKMAANQGKDDYVAVLSRKFQTHVKMIFKQFVVKTRKCKN